MKIIRYPSYYAREKRYKVVKYCSVYSRVLNLKGYKVATRNIIHLLRKTLSINLNSASIRKANVELKFCLLYGYPRRCFYFLSSNSITGKGLTY